ncbi:hypothetical protein H2203_007710 [Taxawa tesnikishii (nom. ined.)]|nr:hypothetical protein H2203_007710 [Dothideales sp. JES 119]
MTAVARAEPVTFPHDRILNPVAEAIRLGKELRNTAANASKHHTVTGTVNSLDLAKGDSSIHYELPHSNANFLEAFQKFLTGKGRPCSSESSTCGNLTSQDWVFYDTGSLFCTAGSKLMRLKRNRERCAEICANACGHFDVTLGNPKHDHQFDQKNSVLVEKAESRAGLDALWRWGR